MENERKQITVAELAALLQRVASNPEHAGLPVAIEGCDCSGRAAGISIYRGNPALADLGVVAHLEIRRCDSRDDEPIEVR